MTSGADVRPGTSEPGFEESQQRYHRIKVPVDRGNLCVGIWEPSENAEDAPVIVALHGITGNHLCWAFAAQAAAGVRIVAPDLRGRGGSHHLSGPFGLAQHADDMARVLDHLGVERAVVLGHSMGAFVGLVAAERHLDRVSSLIMVDGGLPMDSGPTPLPSGPGLPDPVVSRLTLTFPDEASALRFWRMHPALIGQYTRELEEYARHDLGGTPPTLRSRSTPDSVIADAADIREGGHILAALGRLAVPTQWLTAAKGLLNESPGLYPPNAVVYWREQYPGIEVHPTFGLNHYTVILSSRGGEVIAKAVSRAVNGEVRHQVRRDVVVDQARDRVGLSRSAT